MEKSGKYYKFLLRFFKKEFIIVYIFLALNAFVRVTESKGDVHYVF